MLNNLELISNFREHLCTYHNLHFFKNFHKNLTSPSSCMIHKSVIKVIIEHVIHKNIAETKLRQC